MVLLYRLTTLERGEEPSMIDEVDAFLGGRKSAALAFVAVFSEVLTAFKPSTVAASVVESGRIERRVPANQLKQDISIAHTKTHLGEPCRALCVT
jgi:hypothetical protein